MRELVADALRRGWTLLAYEADLSHMPSDLDPSGMEETNWREARNLAQVIAEMPPRDGMLVWCGNHHLAKVAIDDLDTYGFARPRSLPSGWPWCDLADAFVLSVDNAMT